MSQHVARNKEQQRQLGKVRRRMFTSLSASSRRTKSIRCSRVAELEGDALWRWRSDYPEISTREGVEHTRCKRA